MTPRELYEELCRKVAADGDNFGILTRQREDLLGRVTPENHKAIEGIADFAFCGRGGSYLAWQDLQRWEYGRELIARNKAERQAAEDARKQAAAAERREQWRREEAEQQAQRALAKTRALAAREARERERLEAWEDRLAEIPALFQMAKYDPDKVADPVAFGQVAEFKPGGDDGNGPQRLYIWGEWESGKTRATYAYLQRMERAGDPPIFAYAPDLAESLLAVAEKKKKLAALLAKWSGHYIADDEDDEDGELCREPDFSIVLFDDIDKWPTTPGQLRYLDKITDRIYREGIPAIFTANASPARLADPDNPQGLPPAIATRITRGARVVEFRKEVARSES